MFLGRLSRGTFTGCVSIGTAAASMMLMSEPGITPKITTTIAPRTIGAAIARLAGASRLSPGGRRNIAFKTRT